MAWYYQPYFNTGNYALAINEMSPFNSGLFDLGRVTFAGWTLAAFAIGALAGMLIRRVVPAIAATLAVYAGLAFAVGGFLREHYLTPLVTTSLNLPGSAWILSQWWTKGGVTLSQATMVQVMDPIFARNIPAVPSRRCPSLQAGGARKHDAVPHPARVHVLDAVPAGQPVLAVPVDRGRLAARAVGAAPRRHCLAGPPPRGLKHRTITVSSGNSGQPAGTCPVR